MPSLACILHYTKHVTQVDLFVKWSRQTNVFCAEPFEDLEVCASVGVRN